MCELRLRVLLPMTSITSYGINFVRGGIHVHLSPVCATGAQANGCVPCMRQSYASPLPYFHAQICALFTTYGLLIVWIRPTLQRPMKICRKRFPCPANQPVLVTIAQLLQSRCRNTLVRFRLFFTLGVLPVHTVPLCEGISDTQKFLPGSD